MCVTPMADSVTHFAYHCSVPNCKPCTRKIMCADSLVRNIYRKRDFNLGRIPFHMNRERHCSNYSCLFLWVFPAKVIGKVPLNQFHSYESHVYQKLSTISHFHETFASWLSGDGDPMSHFVLKNSMRECQMHEIIWQQQHNGPTMICYGLIATNAVRDDWTILLELYV